MATRREGHPQTGQTEQDVKSQEAASKAVRSPS